MLPTARTRFRFYFQRRTHILPRIIRRNSFTRPPKQLSLFPPHARELHAQPISSRLTLTLGQLPTRLGRRIIQLCRSCMAHYKDKIANI